MKVFSRKKQARRATIPQMEMALAAMGREVVRVPDIGYVLHSALLGDAYRLESPTLRTALLEACRVMWIDVDALIERSQRGGQENV